MPASGIDCFKVMLATAVSLRINGPMLWIHCVGPSSGMKTTIAGIVASAADTCFMVSSFNGFYSGTKTANGSDPGLVPRIQGRVLIIPDLTPLFNSSKDHQNEVFGDFRDIYDGKGRKLYKTGLDRNYDKVVFGCITCVTDDIRKYSRSDLGERFLMSEINANWNAKGVFIPEILDTKSEGNAFQSVFNNMASGLDTSQDGIPTLDELAPERAMCWGLINHLFEWMSEESSNLSSCAKAIGDNSDFKSEVEALAIWLEHARCPMPGKNEDQMVVSRPALPHRSIKQLAKLAMCLCIVEKTTTLTDEVRRLVRKIAFDTSYGIPLRVMNWLAVNPNYPNIQLADAMGCSPTWISRVCNHLQTIGVISRNLRNNNSGNRGAPMMCYDLTEPFRLHATTLRLSPEKEVVPKQLKTLTGLFGRSSANGSSFLERIQRKAQ